MLPKGQEKDDGYWRPVPNVDRNPREWFFTFPNSPSKCFLSLFTQDISTKHLLEIHEYIIVKQIQNFIKRKNIDVPLAHFPSSIEEFVHWFKWTWIAPRKTQTRNFCTKMMSNLVCLFPIHILHWTKYISVITFS